MPTVLSSISPILRHVSQLQDRWEPIRESPEQRNRQSKARKVPLRAKLDKVEAFTLEKVNVDMSSNILQVFEEEVGEKVWS